MIPLNCSQLAITRSVDHHGCVQAIGGVNEKIEGFFDCCSHKGLTGDHGVIIPASNVKDLMLRKDVVEAVKEGNFIVYSVSNIDEGIEVLTGKEAGTPDEKGNYPEGTVFGNVQKKLQSYYEKDIQFRKKFK